MSVAIKMCNDEGVLHTHEENCVCEGMDDCPFCGGSGTLTQEVKLTFFMSDLNFNTFWSSLGLNPDSSNLIHPQYLRNVLHVYDPALCMSSMTKTSSNTYEMGISEDQADRYVSRLDLLVSEAVKREEFIYFERLA
jgi:hypothetical protein